MVGCTTHSSLYVYDTEHMVWQVLVNERNRVNKWLSVKGKNYSSTMSVTSNGQLLLTAFKPKRIDIYGPDAQIVCSVSLPADFGVPLMAAESLEGGGFIIMSPLEESAGILRVYSVNKDGDVLRLLDVATFHNRSHGW